MKPFCLELLLLWACCWPSTGNAQEATPLHPRLQADEQRRVEIIQRASAATVCIYSRDGQAGGSGVIIDSSGLAVSNYHVVDPCGHHMLCGLSDGQVHDAVVIGIDPVGDLALIQIFGREEFPAATWGDSDSIRVGESCFAAGNPFLLANDFQPSISWGIISGKNRYQYPAGTLLEYADCIQTDAAINPGNSGGPLFDSQGLLVGINGRGSFEKRGRVNVGVGYAISINQVRNFLGSLKSGRILDHAFPGFVVASAADQSVRVSQISEESDAFLKGIRYDAEILNLGGREIETVNDVKNIVGTFPSHWSIPVRFRQDDTIREVMIRLDPVHSPEELLSKISASPSAQQPDASAPTPTIIDEHFISRRGYANYFYARQETAKILNGIRARYNPRKISSPRIRWIGKSRLDAVQFVMNGQKSGIKIGDETGTLDGDLPFDSQVTPRGSGGCLNALHLFHEILFENQDRLAISYHGTAPFVSPGSESPAEDWKTNPRMPVLRVLRDGTESWVYVKDDFEIQAIEFFAFPGTFPAVLEFSGSVEAKDQTAIGPARVKASFRSQTFVDLDVEQLQVEPGDALTDPSQPSQEGTRK